MQNQIDFVAQGTGYEIKRGARGVRDVQTWLMQLAQYVANQPTRRAVLALMEVGLSEKRLREEWERFARVLRPELSNRISIIAERDSNYIGIPSPLDSRTRKHLQTYLAASDRTSTKRSDRTRQADFWFVAVLKILMHRLVTSADAMRMNELARAAGCTYPTVRAVLDQLGGVVERTSDRRVRLRWFPKPEFARMAAVAPRVRNTLRLVDRSAAPRTPEQHLKRLSHLGIVDVAIGGVIGARYYTADLDIIGTPRLDLSMGPRWRNVDGAADDLARRLDPALVATKDPLARASVVIHQVPHAAELFVRKGHFLYADSIDCLLDLHEARLDGPAHDLLKAITKDVR